MLFSPQDLKTEHWLPQIPEVAPNQIIDADYLAASVKLQHLVTVNGLPNLQSYLSISGDVQKLNINSSDGNKLI